MDDLSIQPVILCGGSGTRLWPASRVGFPKQFLSLTQDRSLFQQALTRLPLSDMIREPIIVGGHEHRFLLQDQLRESAIESYQLVLEPVQRNTAPAMTLAALAALQTLADPILVVMPADQIIQNNEVFHQSIHRACALALKESAIVLLGVPPNRPETGYGYIKAHTREGIGRIEQFTEKPDVKTAAHYLISQNYWWNSGIFITRASTWMSAISHFRPAIAQHTSDAWKCRSTRDSVHEPERVEFSKIKSESVDYAVLEHCSYAPFSLYMVTLDAGWDDLGSWDAVWRCSTQNSQGNYVQGDVVVKESRNCYVQADSRMVAILGLEDTVVVETADAVLVTRREYSQKVGQLISEAGTGKREVHAQHRKVQRPWGWYDLVDQGPGFKVKRIMVNPGACLSLQKHTHRAEHWVVVSGTARVQCNDVILNLNANQSTYIPQGAIHRLTNPGATPLEIIEVQSGGYLGEDDIVRLEDNYERLRVATSDVNTI